MRKRLFSKKKIHLKLTISSTMSNGWFDHDESLKFHLIPNTIQMFQLEFHVGFLSICCANSVQRSQCMYKTVGNSLLPSNLRLHHWDIWIHMVANLGSEYHELWQVLHNSRLKNLAYVTNLKTKPNGNCSWTDSMRDFWFKRN